MIMRLKTALVLATIAAALLPTTARAATCGRAVLVAMPGITWADVAEQEPPNFIGLIEESAVGSMAVRTNSRITTYASGFATIGSGTRALGGSTTGGPATFEREQASRPVGHELVPDVRAAGLDEMQALSETADYHAVPGALGEALDEAHPAIAIGNSDLGLPPVSPHGFGRWALLTVMDEEGRVDLSATGSAVLEKEDDSPTGIRSSAPALERALMEALERPCSTTVLDPGDLIRADALARAATNGSEKGVGEYWREVSLLAADELLGYIEGNLDPESDLLMVVSPTSPLSDPETHLGVALVRGPGFAPGSWLTSPSTRLNGVVTLPDVAPAILEFFDIGRPASMVGRALTSEGRTSDDPVSELARFDRESVYAHGIQADVSTTFVVCQVVFYVMALMMLRRRSSNGERAGPRLRRTLEWGGLAVVAFPLATYLATPVQAHAIGTFGFASLLVGIDIALVALVVRLRDRALDRLALIGAATISLVILDLALGGQLQLNAVWGNDPINAGRFVGLGNIGFAVLGSSALMTGALLFHRWPQRRWTIPVVAGLFVATVVADGAPNLGSDVGGVLALVPAFGVTLALLMGRRPTKTLIAVAVVASIGFLALFLAIDLARPPSSRTHLGRLYEDVRTRGGSVFVDTVVRKAKANLRIFKSTIWTYLVPPALGVMAWLLFRPRGFWERLRTRHPRLRAGLMGGLVLAVLGFAVNDSGIVVPAMVLSYLVPMALVIHISLDDEEREAAA